MSPVTFIRVLPENLTVGGMRSLSRLSGGRLPNGVRRSRMRYRHSVQYNNSAIVWNGVGGIFTKNYHAIHPVGR